MPTRTKKSNHFTKTRAAALPEAPPLPPMIGALLRVPYEEVRRRIIEQLHERGFDDIQQAHLSVLQYPGPHGKRPSQITTHVGASKQALNYLLNEIERFGYIERQRDRDDARSKRIVLTRRGEAARDVIRQAVRDVERDWAGELGAQRFATLKSLLQELFASVVATRGQ
jgi:DNA-binding MarR family transcriptional regulator